jgi:oligopeptide transport system substrate-binding protein
MLLAFKAISPTVLRVELEYAIPYFLDLIASHSFLAVPHHVTSVHAKWADDANPHFIGNGPYKLTKWKHHNCIILEKNPYYWDQDSVGLDKIELTIIEDSNTELNMFEAGELDWAGYPLSNLPTDALQALAEEKRLHTYPLSGTYYYIFNVEKPPFDNLNIRKAFSLAINRKAIIDNITLSHQTPATSFIPPTIWEVKSHFKDFDLKEARRLFHLGLEEMGCTLETLPKITLIYNTSEAHHKIAQAIQEQWYKAFKIRVKLANVEWKVFLDELAHKQFQVARMGGIAGFNDPITFLIFISTRAAAIIFPGGAMRDSPN